MKVVLQRVAHASVHIDSKEHSSIKQGLLVLLGIEDSDSTEDVLWLSKKIANLRVFSDDSGQMNRSLLEIEGSALVVSQFTLHAATKKGSRPSYIKAAKSKIALPLYAQFISTLENNSMLIKLLSDSNKLVSKYNDCLEEIRGFRAMHLEYAGTYIHKQSQIENPFGRGGSTITGTGGTPFMTYLKKHRDETEQQKK